MTSILNSFDTRLARLEKSVLPLYNSSQILNRRASNIEKALLKMDEVASNQEGIAAEEALILRGPQPGQLDVYKDALERLNASIAFKASDLDTLDTALLVETGAKKLAQSYIPNSSRKLHLARLRPLQVSKSPEHHSHPKLWTLFYPSSLFHRLLPVPSTHPSHPAAAAILTTLKDAPERVQSLLSVAREEYDLFQNLSPLSSPSQLATHFGHLLSPLMGLLSSTVLSLVEFAKRSLQKYGLIVLSAYESLLELQSMWDEVASLRVSSETRSKEVNEYKDILQTLRSVCVRMFPEGLADIKLAIGERSADTSTGLLDASAEAVQFLNNIQDALTGSGDIFTVIGDGNWRMGEGVVVKKQQLAEISQQTLIKHFVYDFAITILNTVNQIAKTQRRPPFETFFLLNNIAYLRRNILEPGVVDRLFVETDSGYPKL
ncbi:hypothetical protein D9757_005962 [Collybiopsis confluens]|uniref:Exocyst complex subunit Exo70 C-terminal domain-containing protein n=1 Tax=Collybiopsis confluens TaxID=2823264 RepID=A0A8H5MCT3_9AGAR|nr:hypothetical protein D9757_005962 [Collybiopsis confluens]